MLVSQPRSGPDRRPLAILFTPIALVASLVALRAVAEGAARGDAGPPDSGMMSVMVGGDAGGDLGSPAHAEASSEVADSEPEAGDAAEDDTDQFTGPLPNLGALPDYPEAHDLLARAHPGSDGRIWSEQGGKKVALTLDAHLQASVQSLLRTYEPPYAAVVALDPHTGRVLAMVQSSKDVPGVRALDLRAVYPAASVFKVVTAAALLEQGVDPDELVCFHGGKHRIQAKLLLDNPGDRTCLDMGDAMAKSANVVFAKLASHHLTPEDLRSEANRFGFNRELPFDQPLDRSPARIPDTSFEFATTAAGFGQVFLSPLHGALLAATVGNKGVMPRPFLIDGEVPEAGRTVVEPEVAAQLSEMMERTISGGTARRAFRERGRSVMKGIDVAGKTGSLDDKKPFRDYTWFVGFAPVENPQIAVAAVIVNGPFWRVRASYVARETLRAFLAPDGKPRVQGRR